jgi:hypothetical protein
LPRRLEIQIELAARYPDTAMFCGATVPIEEGDEEERGGISRGERRGRRGEGEKRTDNGPPTTDHRLPATDQGEALRTGFPVRKITLEELAQHNPVATSSVLVRKDVLLGVGGFDEQFRGPEDYDLWIRIGAEHKIREAGLPLACYRHAAGSLSTDDRRFLPEVLRVIDKAFGPGGALHGRRGRSRARAYHHLACSWMAADRGAMAEAFRLYLKGLLLWPGPFGQYGKLPWARLKLPVYFARCLLRRWGGAAQRAV